ncbi:MAG: hypothetical protein K2X71_01770 [Methylobacterium sp.]|uniref:hypothetical protein n=1 Tax=Methylobacterium sp. TaxID=409 RepID=UPI00258B7651|nr:hypothetical protein [Methylobacterium sp.]MBY0294754.1 hypothetical protein [Methylobacterium sp.]
MSMFAHAEAEDDDVVPGPRSAAERPAAVSGLFQGEMMLPQPGRYLLELRIDVDPCVENSPVMNRISGDLYQLSRTNITGMPTRISRTYIESWIVDRPLVRQSEDRIVIEGAVRFWLGTHAATSCEVVLTWPGSPSVVTAIVTFTETGGAQRSFGCHRTAEYFRSVDLEIDVCASVNQAPLVPRYDTHWHSDRPAGLPRRVLTIEEAYREAGVRVSINPDHTIIDDSDPNFESWSPAELHDAMETHFSQYGGTWPNWQMWGLLAGLFDNPGVGGVMFDAASQVGGAGKAPERQGFAVFRKHEWFNDLIDGNPDTQSEASAMRKFLYTWVHEAGHAYNFLHSWDKGRPDALSWMNYDWRYDARNGQDSFWRRFQFRFDDDELIHLRHGNRAAVIMGGDPWSKGSHLEAPNLAMSQIEGDAPLELLVRSVGYFEFMEPVHIELRLRNLMPDVPVAIDKRLSPEFGGVVIYIQRPDGSIVQYDPIMCAVGTPEIQVLAPGGGPEGADRFSKEIFLSYGSSGFYFDRPGEYRIRAVYQGPGDVTVPSDSHRIRIGFPASREDDRMAQDFFSQDVGLALYLRGSRSPYLDKGREVLERITQVEPDSPRAAKVSMTLAQGLARPFFRIDPAKGKVVRSASADPRGALALTNSAVTALQQRADKTANLAYGIVVRRRAEYHRAAGDPQAAQAELATLRATLAKRGVNRPVLERYEDFEQNLTGTSSGRRRQPAGASRTSTRTPRKPAGTART